MLIIKNAVQAAEVLTACQHRGVHWHFDPELGRVLPEWNLLGEEPVAFTLFEAVAIARGLARIGAVRGTHQEAQDGRYGLPRASSTLPCVAIRGALVFG